MKIEFDLENEIYEQLQKQLLRYNMSIEEYLSNLIKIDVERSAIKCPNFVGYLSPEQVVMIDDYYRAERCMKARNENAASVSGEIRQKYNDANEESKKYIKDTENKLGRAVIDELRNRTF